MKRKKSEEALSSSKNFAEGLHFEFNFKDQPANSIAQKSDTSTFIPSVTTIINPENAAFQFKSGWNIPSFQRLFVFSLSALFFSLCVFSVMHLFAVDISAVGSRLHAAKITTKEELTIVVPEVVAPALDTKADLAPVAPVFVEEEKSKALTTSKKQGVEAAVVQQAITKKEIPSKPIVPAIKETVITERTTPATKKSAYQKALDRSAREGKFTFLKFGATWCTPCKIMESSVFQSDQISELLEQRFVTVNLDVDQSEGLMVKTNFSVEQVPTYILLDERGQELGRINGSTSTKKMLTFLEAVLPFMPESQYVSDLTADVAEK